jgi:hypothetical protein
VTAPSPAPPPEPEPAWSEERSLLGPRIGLIVVAVLAVAVAVCVPILPRAAVTRAMVITDAFDRTGAGLGATGRGQTWVVPTPGAWGTDDGEAFVTDPNPSPGGRTMALVPLGSDNGEVGATISRSAAGWGLVFRYRGPNEFWLLTSSPKFASYNLQHVTDGRARAVDKVSMARQSPGTQVTVRFQGPQIVIEVDGKAVKTVNDSEGGNGGYKVGLVLADGSVTDARWRDFEARRLALSPDGRNTTVPRATGPTTTGG